MKNVLLFCFLSVSLSYTGFSQVTFVDADASGNNDGSSWADAYNSLGNALANTSSGELWIADGTYLPEGGDSTSTFLIENVLALYGGFNGTETLLSQRDPETNLTILSGDFNSDDMEGVFDMNKEDNALHVVVVDSLLNDPVIFDGLIIQGGDASDNNDLNGYFWRGGGILTYSPISVNDCIFRNNFARTGGSICVEEDGHGTSISESLFTQNRSTSQSAGLFLNSISDALVVDCEFTNNQTARGALYPLRCDNLTISDCMFTDNVNDGGFGGALFLWNNLNLKVTNCVFENNLAANAGAIYLDGRELSLEPENVIIEDCQFNNNTVSNLGGGLSTNDVDHILRNCNFRGNTAGGSGGNMFQSSDFHTVRVIHCEFEDGNSEGGWGGGTTAYGDSAFYFFSHCTFEENTCFESGSALYAGFRASVTIDSCIFEGNENLDGIGTIAGQNDSTFIQVFNSSFEVNVSEGSGGALSGNITNSSISFVVDNCTFTGNTVNDGIGGAIHLSELGDDDISTLTLSNSTFIFNAAIEQGGAVNLVNANGEITNCVFYNNTATEAGIGGAISINASDSNKVNTVVINSTFLDNSGALAGGIAHWTGENEASSTLTLQNNIFKNIGPNYTLEDGSPVAISNGGNLDTDETAIDVLDHPTDIFGLDPMLTDPFGSDFTPMLGSPCIDAGVADGAPLFDLSGNPRDTMPDIGALEFQKMVSTEEVIANEGRLWLFPNPVDAVMNIQVDNDWRGELQLRIVDNQGRIVHTWKQNKQAQRWKLSVDTPALPTGVYRLLASNGEQVMVLTFYRR